MENSTTGVGLDGVRAREGRLNAALAAEHGVPVLLGTGDDRTCADATDYAPAATTVAAEERVSRYAAICQPPEVTGAAIRSGAERAMARAGREEGRSCPHRIEIEFDAAHLAAAAAVIPTVEQLDVRRVGFDAPDTTEAMKAFKIVAILAGRAIQDVHG